MSDLIPVAAMAPLELVRLPDHLDGRTGSNRSTLGHAQIAAQTDIDALKAWLARFLDTRTTFDSYRKDPNVCCWATLELGSLCLR